MSESPPPLPSTHRFLDEARNLGKSARTRARLMDAAVQLFARDGFEAASVNEITKVAEVANGTFYVHFRDKEEIAGAVTYGIALEVTRQLNEAMADVDNAIERVSTATRRFIELASSEPDWGRALFRAVLRFPDLREGVVAFARADLERGVAQGVFTAAIDDVLINAFAAITLGALFTRLNGPVDKAAASRVAELQLRMLGVPPDVAHEVSRRPLHPIELRIIPTPRPPRAER